MAWQRAWGNLRALTSAQGRESWGGRIGGGVQAAGA